METKTTIRDRVEAYIHTPGAAMPMCANCAHYYPHYRKDGWPLGCGHCSYPRMKQRRAYDLCEHWEAKKPEKRGVPAPDCNRNGDRVRPNWTRPVPRLL